MRAIARAICLAAGIATISSAAYATRYYFAECRHQSHGYMRFNGPRQATPVEAANDCAEHRKQFPRHRCIVQPIDY